MTEQTGEQVMLQIQLRKDPNTIQQELNNYGSKGYTYGGVMPLLERAGGGIYVIKAQGVYVFRAMLWLNPTQNTSEFHIHRIQQGRKRINLPEEITEITREENANGFILKEALPLNGFVSKDGYRHPGTVGAFLVYQRNSLRDSD